MSSDEIVQARIDSETKRRAAAVLEGMGLSISDAIRLLMLRIVDQQRLPFETGAPNAETVEAMNELASGKGERFSNATELFKDLDL
ncbi:type II toxin-antitoxin system RelB/DinJ family antitoxin [Methylocystis sp. Sn-Cys]|uniref:type II toxin-antitoxin system RelB/DinJ family antitoxin n=1 Tax=Methylocystis sp. Sn-Cys TaxID=1701263 RepID=UPI001920FB8F|nr:type II toxin-antitoxin system RelB/DinJ family antitoxin [Methylocystis sp. Sn-Cys]MBL1258485.1 type II toxin-antitoxin system RelB/DinJ family antitoxin [Methylocystis sp. Sn-Cys]